jgi:flagellar hook-associated protein 2
MASTSGIDLSVAGLASGFDWKSVVQQLAQAERAPEAVWSKNQSKINAKNSAFTIITSYLNQVQLAAKALKDTAIYDHRSATSSTPAVATVSAATGTKAGTYSFNVTQLATAASLTGYGNVSGGLSATNDVSGVTVGTANFATAVQAGTFSVNGAQVAVATTDSLQDVFDKIYTATGNTVTASYDASTDKISLTSPNNITLGSAADTSNFLQVAKLHNNNSGSVTSNDTLGRVNTAVALTNAHLGTAISDGGSGAGAFTINGVEINFNAGTDSVQEVVARINNSAAGVSAAYDVVNNKFSLTNNTTGDVGISLADTTGNFLAAAGLAGGAFNAGSNLNFSVNGGPSLVSRSNTIDGSSSGITGLAVAALSLGATAVTVAGDTTAVQSNIQAFVTAYNNLQSYITANSASSTDATGKVTAGTLTGDVDAANIAATLRTNTFSPVSISGLSATFSQLANLGIKSNGQNNSVTLDSSALTAALAGNLGDVKKLFSDSTGGLAAKLDAFVTNLTGDNGTVVAHQAALTKQSSSIDAQIANLEKTIAADAAHWTAAFRAMETAQSQLTQQLSYLTKNFK